MRIEIKPIAVVERIVIGSFSFPPIGVVGAGGHDRPGIEFNFHLHLLLSAVLAAASSVWVDNILDDFLRSQKAL